MAAAATTTENHRDSDRMALASYDQRAAFDDWLEATMTLQRSYLDWISQSVRLFLPQNMYQQSS